MLKKTLMLSMLLAAVSSPSWADGFYAGVGVGRDAGEFGTKFTTTETDTFYNISTTQTASDNNAGTGYLGSVFAGYGMSFNRFYLAGELGVQASSLEYENSATDGFGDNVKNSYSINHNASLSVLPGYKITDNALIYGRLGYVHGNFDMKSSLTDFNGNTISADKNVGLDGIRYGLGIQNNFNKNFGLRLEYNHITYADYKLSSTYQSGLFETTTNTLKISPSTDQVELAAIYNFG